MKKIFISAALALTALFVFTGDAAFAQNQAVLPKAGLTPENPFYFLDKLGEALQMFFTFKPEGKARLQINFAAERIAEIKVVFEDKGIEAEGIKVAQARLMAHLASAATIVSAQKAKGEDVSALAKELADEFEGPKSAFEQTFKNQKQALEAQEKELKQKIIEARQLGNIDKVESLIQQLGKVKDQKKLLELKEEAAEEALEQEEEHLEEAMEEKEKAEKAIREAERGRQEILDEAVEEGIAVPAETFGKFDDFLSQAKSAFAAGNYPEAKRFGKLALKSLDDIEEAIEELEKAKEKEEELKEEQVEKEQEAKEVEEERLKEETEKKAERLEKEREKAEEETRKAEEKLRETGNDEESGEKIIKKVGEREGSFLIQKINSNNVEGLWYLAYPVQREKGEPRTLYIGDDIGYACEGVSEKLIAIDDEAQTVTFYKVIGQPPLGGCPICLSDNTFIDTPSGLVLIKDLQVGMPIWTINKTGQRVAAVIIKTSKVSVPPTHRMVYLVLNDGRELFVSPGHPTIDGRTVGDLVAGDLYDNASVISTERVSYGGDATYDILPSGDTGFYWANGILISSTLR